LIPCGREPAEQGGDEEFLIRKPFTQDASLDLTHQGFLRLRVLTRSGSLKPMPVRKDQSKSEPDIDWNQLGNLHFVHWYVSDSRLTRAIGRYFLPALNSGKAAIAIATREHLEGIEQALAELGLDPLQLQKSGLYIALDAQETLDRLMVQGRPDTTKFVETIGALVSRASMSWGGVRAFGEMVALLWDEGNRAGAVQLEELWNDLARVYPFALFCAYQYDANALRENDPSFQHVCDAHSLIVL
jgi:hypothetical protein